MYDGELVNDKRNGKGIYYYPNGDKYEGDWFDDKINGNGIYTWSSGSKYLGEFQDNKRHGKGVFYFNKDPWKGDHYDGDWLNDKKHGQGNYYFSNTGYKVVSGRRQRADLRRGKWAIKEPLDEKGRGMDATSKTR